MNDQFRSVPLHFTFWPLQIYVEVIAAYTQLNSVMCAYCYRLTHKLAHTRMFYVILIFAGTRARTLTVCAFSFRHEHSRAAV